MTTFEGRFEADHGAWLMILRWSVAGSLVLALHGAAAFALVNHVPPESEAAGVPEAAILIDLAPPPEAAAAPPPPEATLPEPVAEPPPPEPVPPEPVPEAPLPEPIVEPEPVPAPPEPVVEPLPEPEPPPSERVEDAPPETPVLEEVVPVPGNVPLPVLRPTPPPPEPVRKVEKRSPPPERRVEKREAPVRQTPRRQASQPPASTAMRGVPQRQASQGAPVSAASNTRWQGRILSRLNRYKRTPRGGGEGTVTVSFTMDASGRVTGARVTRSAGSTLDEAALALVRRAGPYPAPPSGGTGTITVPIRFN